MPPCLITCVTNCRFCINGVLKSGATSISFNGQYAEFHGFYDGGHVVWDIHVPALDSDSAVAGN